eukprot:scaffold389_cov382-Prasinococcus_capsulatus_cf.AAC.31
MGTTPGHVLRSAHTARSAPRTLPVWDRRCGSQSAPAPRESIRGAGQPAVRSSTSGLGLDRVRGAQIPHRSHRKGAARAKRGTDSRAARSSGTGGRRGRARRQALSPPFHPACSSGARDAQRADLRREGISGTCPTTSSCCCGLRPGRAAASSSGGRSRCALRGAARRRAPRYPGGGGSIAIYLAVRLSLARSLARRWAREGARGEAISRERGDRCAVRAAAPPRCASPGVRGRRSTARSFAAGHGAEGGAPLACLLPPGVATDGARGPRLLSGVRQGALSAVARHLSTTPRCVVHLGGKWAHRRHDRSGCAAGLDSERERVTPSRPRCVARAVGGACARSWRRGCAAVTQPAANLAQPAAAHAGLSALVAATAVALGAGWARRRSRNGVLAKHCAARYFACCSTGQRCVG